MSYLELRRDGELVRVQVEGHVHQDEEDDGQNNGVVADQLTYLGNTILSIFLSTNLSIYLSIYLVIFFSINLSIYLSICIYQPIKNY